MSRIKMLRGSTMVEMLVMMLVAGIIFLAVMDGLTLFCRLQAQRAEALIDAGRRTDGYYRIVALITHADSVVPGIGKFNIYRGGGTAELQLIDSVLVCNIGEFRDTLFDGVDRLHLSECAPHPDTVEITMDGYLIKFPVRRSMQVQYRTMLDEIEKEINKF